MSARVQSERQTTAECVKPVAHLVWKAWGTLQLPRELPPTRTKYPLLVSTAHPLQRAFGDPYPSHQPAQSPASRNAPVVGPLSQLRQIQRACAAVQTCGDVAPTINIPCQKSLHIPMHICMKLQAKAVSMAVASWARRGPQNLLFGYRSRDGELEMPSPRDLGGLNSGFGGSEPPPEDLGAGRCHLQPSCSCCLNPYNT